MPLSMIESCPASADKVRLDKWLWSARLFNSRQAAAHACVNRKVRIDGRVVDKAHAAVRYGAVIAFSAGDRVRVTKVLRLVDRRVPPQEVPSVYEDLSPPAPMIDYSFRNLACSAS
jgi:ribosome-associated heat shock protein Hsp15